MVSYPNIATKHTVITDNQSAPDTRKLDPGSNRSASLTPNHCLPVGAEIQIKNVERISGGIQKDHRTLTSLGPQHHRRVSGHRAIAEKEESVGARIMYDYCADFCILPASCYNAVLSTMERDAKARQCSAIVSGISTKVCDSA